MALANHLVEDLLQTAEFLIESAQQTRGNLGKTYRRRGISTAYYAVFHAVGYILTDTLIGWGQPTDLLEPVFRSLDHKVARDRLVASNEAGLREIGLVFARLQEMRNDADYRPPVYNPGRVEAMNAIQQARNAVVKIEALDAETRRRLAVSIITRKR